MGHTHCSHGQVSTDGLPPIGDPCWSAANASGRPITDYLSFGQCVVTSSSGVRRSGVLAHTMNLADLHTAARSLGMAAHIDGLGGNTVGLHVRPWSSGPLFLVTLDDGNESGTEWTVGLADGSDDSGPCPVTSDAEQTMRDALAWMGGTRTLPDTFPTTVHLGLSETCAACRFEFGGPVEPEHSILRDELV